MSSYISSHTNKKPIIHSRDSSTSSGGRSSHSYYSDKYYSSSSSDSSMANKEYYSSSGPRVEYRRDAHAESKKVKVTHRDGTTTYEYRAGRPEEHAPSSREAYDYYKSSERQERRDRDRKSKPTR